MEPASLHEGDAIPNCIVIFGCYLDPCTETQLHASLREVERGLDSSSSIVWPLIRTCRRLNMFCLLGLLVVSGSVQGWIRSICQRAAAHFGRRVITGDVSSHAGLQIDQAEWPPCRPSARHQGWRMAHEIAKIRKKYHEIPTEKMDSDMDSGFSWLCENDRELLSEYAKLVWELHRDEERHLDGMARAFPAQETLHL